MGISCDVIVGYLRDDVVESGCWVCLVEYVYMRRGGVFEKIKYKIYIKVIKI